MAELTDAHRLALCYLLSKKPQAALAGAVVGLLVALVGNDLVRVWAALEDLQLVDGDDPDMRLPN